MSFGDWLYDRINPGAREANRIIRDMERRNEKFQRECDEIIERNRERIAILENSRAEQQRVEREKQERLKAEHQRRLTEYIAFVNRIKREKIDAFLKDPSLIQADGTNVYISHIKHDGDEKILMAEKAEIENECKDLYDDIEKINILLKKFA